MAASPPSSRFPPPPLSLLPRRSAAARPAAGPVSPQAPAHLLPVLGPGT